MPHRLLFDLESDGLLPELTKIHCIAAVDPDTGEEFSWKPWQLAEALEALSQADTLLGHNIIGFDLRALEKVYGFRSSAKHIDTLVLSRLIYPNLTDTDGELVGRKVLPGKMHGKHSLEAWGYRLGEQKIAFDGPWNTWSEEMGYYMEQDVRTNFKLLQHLNYEDYSPQAVELEHRVARVCQGITEEGWPFDMEKATTLHAQLIGEQARIKSELIADFGSWEELDREFVAKRDDKKRGRVKGELVKVYKTVEFNPGSRQHIFKQLQLLGWKPSVFTEGGQPKVDEEILSSLEDKYPQAKKLTRFLMLEKRLGQLAEGNNAWLKLVQNGKIHAGYIPNGAVTGRAAHFQPNIAQVPALKDRKGREQPFGKECRELFHVPKGWKQIGADMSGLELRCLSHYLTPLDDGAYAKVLLDGDIHSFNQKAAGLPDRNMAKTFIYAWLYGAGAEKIGKITNGGKAEGSKLISQFLRTVPAVKSLRDKVAYNISAVGHLKGLDGRRLPIRSEHSALNTLLQSAGAILCKQWLADSYDALVTKGLKHGWSGDFVILGYIHDEIQLAVREGLEEEAGRIVTECATRAGEPYNFRVRLDSEFKIGTNWSECH